MRSLVTLVLLAIASHASAAENAAWLEAAPASLGNLVAIPDASFFEIPVSRLPTAQAWLATSLVLEQKDGAYFGRPDFRCAPPLKLYLVRALYVNGGTGRFKLFWAGSSLVVVHESLGYDHPPSQTALVACLSTRPSAVYSTLGGAL